MKYIKILLFSLFALCACMTLPAQDIHFSMFDLSPLTMNPAHTGSFLGTIRVGGIHRTQWQSSSADFATTSLYVDSPILAVGKKKRDWIGIGMTLLNDVAGRERAPNNRSNITSGGLTTSFAIPSAAFHKVLDKKGNYVLTFGVQIGAVSRNFDVSSDILTPDGAAASLGFQVEDIELDQLVTRAQVDQNSGLNLLNSIPFTDVSTGLLLTSKINDDSRLVVGAAIGHIVKIGEYSIINPVRDTSSMAPPPPDPDENDQTLKRPATIKFHANLDQQITEKISVHPGLFFQTTKGLTEMMLHANVGYQLNDDFQVLGGLGFRLANAGILMGGVQYKDWRVRMAYDLNVGQVAQVGLQNTFEIGASYIIKIFQEPKVDPVILCPKF
ncbi:MAG: PorP/SprF family type IX secretion system membrane protein [Bacteroidota bacterium]